MSGSAAKCYIMGAQRSAALCLPYNPLTVQSCAQQPDEAALNRPLTPRRRPPPTLPHTPCSAVDNILMKLARESVPFVRLGREGSVHPAVRPWVPGGERYPRKTTRELAALAERVPVVSDVCLLDHTWCNAAYVLCSALPRCCAGRGRASVHAALGAVQYYTVLCYPALRHAVMWHALA